MADFNEVKQKAGATAGYIAEKSVGFAKNTASKAKQLRQIVKHKTSIGSEKENMKKNFIQLGRKYYELFGSEPDERLQQLCELIAIDESKIKDHEDSINAIRAEMKNGAVQKNQEKEKEMIIDLTEEAADTAEEKAEEIKDAVENVIEDVKETAENAAENAEASAADIVNKAEAEVEGAVEKISEIADNISE